MQKKVQIPTKKDKVIYGKLDQTNNSQKVAINKLFTDNPLFELSQAVIVHNDFADWNLLTDGKNLTGILDWDECVAGSPISDIACWSTFFEPERLHKFLEGY